MLGAPGDDGVFRFEPSPPDEGPVSRPEDDDEAVRDWFDTAPDPVLARAVAEAERQARRTVPSAMIPSVGVPELPGPSEAPPAPRPAPPAAGPGLPPGAHPGTDNPGTPPLRPRPAPPGPAPHHDPMPESAVPTPPHGVPQVPPGRGGEHRPAENRGTDNGASSGSGPDTPARPGYPSPPPRG
jgi:hypothetical protein